MIRSGGRCILVLLSAAAFISGCNIPGSGKLPQQDIDTIPTAADTSMPTDTLMPTDTTAPTEAPTATKTPKPTITPIPVPEGCQIYIVQEGDNCWTIWNKFDMTDAQFFEINSNIPKTCPVDIGDQVLVFE